MAKKRMKRPNGTGGVKNLGKGRRNPYMAFRSIKTLDGIRKIDPLGYFPTEEEAHAFLDEYYSCDIVPNISITLEDLFLEWKKYYFDYIGKDTKANYMAIYNKRLCHLYKVPFSNIRTAHLNKIASDMTEASESSRKKYKQLITHLYNYAIENGIVTVNLGEHINIKNKADNKGVKKERAIFSDLQIKTLFKNDSLPYVDTILILIFTGMRIGEMLKLTKFNVDLKNQIIIGGSKTDAGKDRIIPIHPDILKYINKYYDNCQDGGQLIKRSDGEELKYEHYLKYIFKPTLEQLGIKDITPHCCRHTFATKFAVQSGDMKSLQDIMGHEDYAFSVNKYTHKDLDKMKNEIKKLSVGNR